MIRKIINKLKRMYVSFERFPYVNWFNPFCTLYLNFRCFPFRQAIKLPVFIYGRPRLYSLYGTMECIDKCYPGMVKFNTTICGAPCFGVGNSEINHWGRIIFHGKSVISTCVRLNTSTKGCLEIGNDTKIFHQCNIAAYSKVFIGSHSRIAHKSQVLDTNFHFIADFNKNRVKKIAHPIIIGDYCWICNSTTVTGGAVIPNKTIVASNSLVGKDYSNISEESMIGGIPAKFIATGYRRVENKLLEGEIIRFFNNNPNEEYYPLQEDINHNCCNV